MNQKMLNLILTLATVVLFVQAALSQTAVQFQIPITITNGTNSQILRIGVSGDGPNPPGTILDNTIGADTDPLFGAYLENLAPPPPPPPFDFDARIVTIPSRISIFPTGLGGGVFGDYRGYFSPSQVDSFKIVISGDATDNATTTVSWPSNLNLYGTTWTIKPQTGSDWPTTNMLTTTSVDIGAALQKNIIIIKQGAFAPSPGPNFVLNTSSLNFGNVAVGNSSTLPVTVTNTGTVNALSITGVTSIANYTVTPNPPGSYPITVAPGASRNFDVTFTPPSAGTFGGDIQFAHNASGSPTPLTVTGAGQSQGGQLTFAAGSRTRFDNTMNYQDSLTMNYVGQPLAAMQLRIITHGLTIVRSVSAGSDLPSPAWGFSSLIARGPTNADGSSDDTIKVFIYGNGSTTLAPGSYNSLVRFAYDIVNISDPDVQTTSISLAGVLGSLEMGTNAGVTAGPDQSITVNNRTLRGDINNDDNIDILDLLMVVDHILGRNTLTGNAFTRADVAPWPAGDGSVDALDYALIRWMILNHQYPDGTPIGRPTSGVPVVAGGSAPKLNPGMEAKVTFYLTSEGIAVRLENATAVKGIQVEFGNVTSAPDSIAITTALGQGFSKLTNQTFRVLLFNENATVIPAGDRIVANIPFSLMNPQGVTLENVVLADPENHKLNKTETEFSYSTPEELPVDFALSRNYPNPFNPSTHIKFAVPQTSDVRISIYNVLGQEVRTLFEGSMDRGTRVVEWDGRDNNGRQLSSGVYVYRMTAGSFIESHKMMLLK